MRINKIKQITGKKGKNIVQEKNTVHLSIDQKSNTFESEKILQNIILLENLHNFLDRHFALTQKEKKSYLESLKEYLEDFPGLTKKTIHFLISALFILDSLKDKDQRDFDYSPAILQFCRAVEWEVKRTFFKDFHKYLRLKYNHEADLESFMAFDLSTNGFKGFSKAMQKPKFKAELGPMIQYMSCIQNENKLNQSDLLQEFKYFLQTKFNPRVLAIDFWTKIDEMRSEFRNKAAHTESLNKQIAENCKEKVQLILADLLKNKIE